jgi:hypothetical protein
MLTHILTRLPLLAFRENAALTQTEFVVMRFVLLALLLVIVAVLVLMVVRMSAQGSSLKRQVESDYGLKLNGEDLRIAAAGDGVYRVSNDQVLVYESEHNRMVLQTITTP